MTRELEGSYPALYSPAVQIATLDRHVKPLLWIIYWQNIQLRTSWHLNLCLERTRSTKLEPQRLYAGYTRMLSKCELPSVLLAFRATFGCAMDV
jgi:hypothetical protein